jgi:hypothetical protein
LISALPVLITTWIAGMRAFCLSIMSVIHIIMQQDVSQSCIQANMPEEFDAGLYF